MGTLKTLHYGKFNWKWYELNYSPQKGNRKLEPKKLTCHKNFLEGSEYSYVIAVSRTAVTIMHGVTF